jgi:uncharacterized repeat protein (TIGR01451 family)
MTRLHHPSRFGVGILTACALVGASAMALPARADASADLSISQSVTGAPIVGQKLTYTITVTNSGPDAATQVAFSDGQQTGSRINSVSGTGTCFKFPPDTPVAVCQVGTLMAGASATMTLVVTTGIPGPNESQASVQSNGGTPDPNFLNNNSTLTTQVAALPTDIQVTGFASTGSPTTGSTFTYTYQIKNSGPAGAGGVTFTDTLPAALTFVNVNSNDPCSETDGTVSCDLQGLIVGAQTTVTITVVAPANPGTITNVGAASSSLTTDTQPANNSFPVTVQVR